MLGHLQGNLSAFVEKKPEAKAYYDLQESSIKFVLPEPGFLEGIKSKDRAILKMHKVGFRWVYCTLHLKTPSVIKVQNVGIMSASYVSVATISLRRASSLNDRAILNMHEVGFRWSPSNVSLQHSLSSG